MVEGLGFGGIEVWGLGFKGARSFGNIRGVSFDFYDRGLGFNIRGLGFKVRFRGRGLQ